MRRFVIAAALVALGIVGLVRFASTAGATNLDVSVSSACEGTLWVVRPTVHNAHDAPLHFKFDNSVELWGGTVDAGKTISARIIAPGDTFNYEWSTTDGILIGTKKATLTRPTGCSVATTTTSTTTTTVPEETSTTTTVPPVVASAPPVEHQSPPAGPPVPAERERTPLTPDAPVRSLPATS